MYLSAGSLGALEGQRARGTEQMAHMRPDNWVISRTNGYIKHIPGARGQSAAASIVRIFQAFCVLLATVT